MKKVIKYGDYVCPYWNGIISLEDPLFLSWWDRVKPYLDGYEFWIYGGVLEDWLSFDVDATIIGPYNPDRINYMLENIVRISFEYGIFPDIKYSIDGKLFTWSEYMRTKETVTCKYAYYQPHMEVDDKLIEWGTKEDGLWVASRTWPMSKSLNKNHTFQDPIKLF